MHRTFRHTALPQTINSLIGCTSHDLTGDWSLASTHFVDSQYPFGCSFRCSFIEPDVLKTMYRSTIPLRFIWSICSGN